VNLLDAMKSDIPYEKVGYAFHAYLCLHLNALKLIVILPHLKGVVHFCKKKTFADNLLTPMSSKISMSFVLQSERNEGF